MNNICVVNINWLGDAIFSTPVFKALKKAYPHARITCLCVPRVKEVLTYCPYVDKIIVYDERKKHRHPWKKLKLINQIRKEKFDTCFILHRSMTRALMIYLAGIPQRIGYSKTKFLLTHPVNFTDEGIHRSDSYLKVLEGFGIKVEDRLCELRLKLEDMQSVDQKLSAAGIGEAEDFVVLNVGGNWDLKRWPLTSFSQLVQRIYDELGLKAVLPGAEKDKADCELVVKAASVPAVILAGATTLGESLALYKRAKVVISSDTGPLHLAQSVGADVIGIFGPTRPEITGPRGMGRREIFFKDVGCNKAPCYHLTCTNNVCMQGVTVDDVFQTFKTKFN